MSCHCVKSLHLERSEFKDNKLCVTPSLVAYVVHDQKKTKNKKSASFLANNA